MATYKEGYGPGPGYDRKAQWHETRIANNSAQNTPGLDEGASGAGYVKTTNAIDYKVNGKLYTLSSSDDKWDLSGSGADFSTVGSDEYCKILLTLESDGTPGAFKGKVASSYDEAPLPMPPSGHSAIGYLKVNDIDFGTDSIASGDHIDGYDVS